MHLPKPETMLAYASILEKPQYWIDPRGRKWLLATGEIIETACAALRYCAETRIFVLPGGERGVICGGRFDGWLCWLHPDGQFVTLEKLKAEAPSVKCTACGYEQGEHHYMGACYGICGEFVPASGKERI